MSEVQVGFPNDEPDSRSSYGSAYLGPGAALERTLRFVERRGFDWAVRKGTHSPRREDIEVLSQFARAWARALVKPYNGSALPQGADDERQRMFEDLRAE